MSRTQGKKRKKLFSISGEFYCFPRGAVRSCLLGRSQEMSQNMYLAYTRQKKEKTFFHFLGHAVNVILTPIVVNNLAKLFLGKKNEFIVYLTLSLVIANANDRVQEGKKSTNRAKGSMHSSFVGRLQKLCCPGIKKNDSDDIDILDFQIGECVFLYCLKAAGKYFVESIFQIPLETSAEFEQLLADCAPPTRIEAQILKNQSECGMACMSYSSTVGFHSPWWIRKILSFVLHQHHTSHFLRKLWFKKLFFLVEYVFVVSSVNVNDTWILHFFWEKGKKISSVFKTAWFGAPFSIFKKKNKNPVYFYSARNIFCRKCKNKSLTYSAF